MRRAAQRRSAGTKKDAAALKREAAEAVQTLRARGFFKKSKLRPRKIIAIQTLAGQCHLESLPLIIGLLEDGDALIRGAAETALGEYAMQATNETVLRALVYALLEGLRSRNDEVRRAIRALLKRLGPGREPLHSKLVAMSQHETDALVRAEASRLLLEDREDDVLSRLELGADAETEAPTEEEEPSETEPPETPRDYEAVMRAKRQYLRARQEWIRGGKKGEAPKPPPELKGE
jgi:hypothetical protein